MRKIAVVLLFACFGAFAQTKSNKPAAKETEWDQLDKAFIGIVQALEKGDKTAFLALSIKELDCPDCVGSMDVTKDGVFVPADFFFTVISKDFTKSPVYIAMVNKGYSFSSIIVEGFKPHVMPRDYPKDLKLYEVWVETYKPGELSKSHTGASHSFRFVKVNGKFRFYGLNSIP